MRKIKIISLMLAILLMLSLFVSCNNNTGDAETTGTEAQSVETESSEVRQINGVALEEYTIVYSSKDVDYSERAAKYISEQIEARTTVKLDVKKDSEGLFDHEIVVGETSRDISKALNADTQNVQFAILADENHIALEGDYFIIAAAAYFFVETYVTGEYFNAEVPKEVSIHEPIVKEAKNYIMLIGDGMGFNQTKIFEKLDAADKKYSDGEDIFYGYLLPYRGQAKTGSANNKITDSAAGGTALATGYKTNNSYIGKDKDKNDIQSLTELAGSLNMSTAVMSTDEAAGATPAAFSAHADSRYDEEDIAASQAELQEKYGTIIECHLDGSFDKNTIKRLEQKVNNTLDKLSENENGFFMMYEAAKIDGYCHGNDLEKTFDCMVRFNQIIGIVMEFAFYNPETFVLITADHETGGLTKDFEYTSGDHTAANVPIFAYGDGANKFNKTAAVENIQIPKTIASYWGVKKFGQD